MAVRANSVYFDEDGLRMLCAHIIKKAAKDYYRVCLQNRDEDFYYKQRMQEFFRSTYYSSICSIDGNHLMRVIERRAKRGEKLFKCTWGGEYE